MKKNKLSFWLWCFLASFLLNIILSIILILLVKHQNNDVINLGIMIGQLLSAVATIFIPIIVIFISRQIQREVEVVSDKNKFTIEEVSYMIANFKKSNEHLKDDKNESAEDDMVDRVYKYIFIFDKVRTKQIMEHFNATLNVAHELLIKLFNDKKIIPYTKLSQIEMPSQESLWKIIK